MEFGSRSSPENALSALCRSSMAAMSCRGVPSPALRLFSFSHLRIALEFHLIIGYRSILRHRETHGSKGREGSEIQ